MVFKLLLLIILVILLLTNLININIIKSTTNSIRYYLPYNNHNKHVTIVINREEIKYNEKIISYNDLQNELGKLNPHITIIYLINNIANSNSFELIHDHITNKGFKTIISNKSPDISYK